MKHERDHAGIRVRWIHFSRELQLVCAYGYVCEVSGRYPRVSTRLQIGASLCVLKIVWVDMGHGYYAAEGVFVSV